MTIKQHKVVVALPIPLEPDSIYYVRNGGGFDIHVTNNSGVVVGYELNASLDKVDKVAGKQLSDENYTLTEKQKLSGIADEATKNRADSENADKVHTHTTDGITDMSVSGKSVATGTPSQGRDALFLGTSATKNVGTATGNVMEVGAFGVGSARQTNWVGAGVDINTGISADLSAASGLTGLPSGFTQTRTTKFTFGHNSYPAVLLAQKDNKLAFFSGTLADPANYVEIYHTGNTTKNPDGTLKASSPVINLYTDKHDLHNEGQFGATPTVTRKSKGVYEITGTLGLRADGWYLDTPSDRNGNKYFNIEWTQNITPDAADGVVDEYRDDITVTIETFERAWNKDTGLFENGAPMDINDLQDRFVQLRFNELKIEQEELDDDLP